ncbi:MAG: hypothetical protein U9N61_01655 [Euryarchaeota archaeon]|nr:hypothetical protein [Euryarchaeota archaeon]
MSTATAYDWKDGDRTPSNPDEIITTLPNAGSVETGVFEFGKVQARVEAEIFAQQELTIADGATFQIELFWDTDRDGSFTNSRVVNAFAPSGSSEVIPAGGSLGLFSPESDVELFCKVKYTASGNLSGVSAKLDLYPIA